MAEDTPASTDASYQEHDTAVALLANHGTCAGDMDQRPERRAVRKTGPQ